MRARDPKSGLRLVVKRDTVYSSTVDIQFSIQVDGYNSSRGTIAIDSYTVSNWSFRHGSVEFDLNSKSYTLYCRQDSTGNSRTKPQIKRQFVPSQSMELVECL